MQTAQIFETTIIEPSSQHAAHLIVIPSRSLYTEDYTSVEAFLPELELRLITKDVGVSNLSRSLAVILSDSDAGDEAVSMAASEGAIETKGGLGAITLSDMEFAEIVAFDKIVPIEQSPLSAEALATLVTKASGPALGAFVGFVAFGATPMLLVGVPAGMIICGAARGIADALESGLRERLIGLLKERKSPLSRKGVFASAVRVPARRASARPPDEAR